MGAKEGARVAAILALAILGGAGRGAAQLSPGPLSAPHAGLEGSSNCLECHSSEKGVDPRRCLSCHTVLAERVVAGRGLHARSENADCKTCHIDHHGREFELVWWGEQGQEVFEHALTGHQLQGRHADLGCRDCHRAELNRDADRLRLKGKDLGRTFLGLGTECLACHRDEHRGQFETDRCLSCHSQQQWLPAAGFRHQETRFPLTRRHREVACERCHGNTSEALGDGGEFAQFVDMEFGSCADCHEDSHSGRFGVTCGRCHSTAGWHRIDEARFDHDVTHYPLRGRHRRVGCESCHRRGAPNRGVRFARCTDCHLDEHAGQLASRVEAGGCESCHGVEGFLPARYTLEDHDAVFRLEGAHRSVDCIACHVMSSSAELVREGVITAVELGEDRELRRFRIAAATCGDCHADPHAGTVDAVSAPLGCTTCHDSLDWAETSFDHGVTSFPLSSPHAALGCLQCHAPDTQPADVAPTFATLGTDCASCHSDPHLGQFAAAGEVADCRRCHAAKTWLPVSGFDHQTDAAFQLEGAHARVLCDGCHRVERIDGRELVRFKPLGQRCSDCHRGR